MKGQGTATWRSGKVAASLTDGHRHKRVGAGGDTAAMNQPEQWQLDAGDRAIGRLDVPPHATRERVFELDVRFVVRAGAGAQPRHGLRVLVNGNQEWARQIDTERGGNDSLEWRQRRRVPTGESLRLQALTEVRQGLRLRLLLSAIEVGPDEAL